MAKLIAQSGHSLELPMRRVTFGEASSCDIPLSAGLGLGLCHFEIEHVGPGKYLLRDLSGGAGVQVNGSAIEECILSHGNVITAGSLRLGFWCTEESEPGPSPFLGGTVNSGLAEGDEAQRPAPPAEPPAIFVAASFEPSAELAALEAMSPPAPIPVPPEPMTPSEPAPVLPAADTTSDGPPVAWTNPASLDSSPATIPPALPATTVMAGSPESNTPVEDGAAGKPAPSPVRPLHLRRTVKFSKRRLVLLSTGGALAACIAVAAANFQRIREAISPALAKVESWTGPERPVPRVPPAAPPTAEQRAKVAAAAVTPETEHNDVVKRFLTERARTLFFVDLGQLVPYYNATAAARSLPPQKEISQAFRKYYGIFIDQFDRLSCMTAPGKDEFLIVLSSKQQVDLESVLGIPVSKPPDAPPAGVAAAPAGRVKTIRIYSVKANGRSLGAALYDPFTVVLGKSAWIDAVLNGHDVPSLREATCLFPETAHKAPGAIIISERLTEPPTEDGDQTPVVFETSVTNLFLKDAGESRLMLTRNPEVKEQVFIQRASASLREQAETLLRVARASQPQVIVKKPVRKPAEEPSTPADGETITVNEASIIIADGELIIRDAIDSVARAFLSHSPTVELILAAQTAVVNFNRARLSKAQEALDVKGVSQALELLQNGITAGAAMQGQTFKIEQRDAAQIEEIARLLQLDDKVGLVYRPDTSALSGGMLDLAVKARDYRNAELLISLWRDAGLGTADAQDVNGAVRKVLTWANGAGRVHRIAVGLPSFTQDELMGALSLLGLENGRLTWKRGEEGYRAWLKKVNPDPKADAKKIARLYNAATKTSELPGYLVRDLSDVVRLLHGGSQISVMHEVGFTAEEISAASRYLRLVNGSLVPKDY